MNNTIISTVTEHKHLGLQLSDDGNWNKHIYNYLIDNNLITTHQSGFTPGDSAVNQLLYITNEFDRALDEGKGL
jgi:hypothetical protein